MNSCSPSFPRENKCKWCCRETRRETRETRHHPRVFTRHDSLRKTIIMRRRNIIGGINYSSPLFSVIQEVMLSWHHCLSMFLKLLSSHSSSHSLPPSLPSSWVNRLDRSFANQINVRTTLLGSKRTSGVTSLIEQDSLNVFSSDSLESPRSTTEVAKTLYKTHNPRLCTRDTT